MPFVIHLERIPEDGDERMLLLAADARLPNADCLGSWGEHVALHLVAMVAIG